MTEILFYHLERQGLEQVLPVLLNKTLERGWRATVRCPLAERIPALSDAIWSWREESFIPHGTADDGNAPHQPVWITPEEDVPNGATVLFCVEGAVPREEELGEMERIIVMFHQHDAAALERARELWRRWKEREDLALTYWQQDATGRWQKRASASPNGG